MIVAARWGLSSMSSENSSRISGEKKLLIRIDRFNSEMMKTVSLDEITRGESWIGLGIAGNQAGHLSQAGEAGDFTDVVAEENAPKGMFPWYIPGHESFLSTNPVSSSTVTSKEGDPIQPEPEIGLVVEFHYAEGDVVESLSVRGFSAFNDFSRRIPAPKISLKKNWGPASQGLADKILPVEDFHLSGGLIDQFRLGCYVVRSGELLQYGEDTAVSDYCYFNQKLVDWIIHQINTQQDVGPLEQIGAMVNQVRPSFAVIGIGATCYTEFGNSAERFVQVGDEVIVVAYDQRQLTQDQVEEQLRTGAELEGALVLRQTVS